MSIKADLVIGGILLFAIVLLAANLVTITVALYSLGISGLFKTIEEVFEGKVTGAEDLLIYAGIISASIFVIFALIIAGVIVVGVISAIVGAPEEAGVAVVGAVGEESGILDFLPGIGHLVTGSIGVVLVIILIIVVFVSTASGILCFIAASEIKKDPKFSGKSSLRDAYTYSIIAGVLGIAIVVFAIIGIVGYFSLKYYIKKEKKIVAEKKKKAQQLQLKKEAAGFLRVQVAKKTGKIPPPIVVKAPATTKAPTTAKAPTT